MKKAFVYFVCALPAIQSFGWSMLAGIIGTLVLAGFFSTIMSLDTLSILLPVIIGVNAAISGYMLIERDDGEIKRKKTMGAAVGALVAIMSFISVNALCFKLGGFFLMSDFQGMVAAVIGIFGGWLGGILSVKHRDLNAQVTVR